MGLFSKKEYKGTLVWENLMNEGGPKNSYRTKIPGGWLFAIQEPGTELGSGSGITFIPDPEHRWNGNSK